MREGQPPGLSGYEIVQLSTELSSSFPGELDFCAETGRGSGASSPPALTSPHPGVTKTKKLRIWYLPPLIALWLLIDLLFGVPIVWKLTRTEAWVRVGDPELHHAFRPMSQQTEKYGSEEKQIFINSLGAKDESCREVPPVVVGPRVALFGDSFTEGWGLSFAETVPGQLRRRLASNGVDVVGFGISSHCPSLTRLWMKKLLREGVRWDLALLLIDPGDSFDEIEVQPFLRGKNKPTRKNLPKFLRLRWYEYSLSYQAWRQVRNWIHPEPCVGRDLRQALLGNEWKVAWLDQPNHPPPWFREGLEQSARAVEEIQAIAKREGFPLGLVIYPYPKMLALEQTENAYTDYWTQFAQKQGLPLLNLTPLFTEEAKSVERVYRENFIPGDFHWNAEGSARVAEHLLPWVRKNLPARGALPSTIHTP